MSQHQKPEQPLPEDIGEPLPFPEPAGAAAEEAALDLPAHGEFPVALRRLHQRLNSPLELYKLHLKHYHMSPAQFRRRTSELHLPEEACQKYDAVVKRCAIFAEGALRPRRSHVSGLRASNVGDQVAS